MALTQRLKQGFLRLSLSQQVGLLSSLCLSLSPFLSWYEERGSTGAIHQVIGLEGPLFLIGTLVAVLGSISFLSAFIPLLGAHFYERASHLAWVDIASAGLSLLLIGLGSSVFFHPEFGLNLAAKHLGVGFIMALTSASVLGIVGLWNRPNFRSVVLPSHNTLTAQHLMPEVSDDNWSRERVPERPVHPVLSNPLPQEHAPLTGTAPSNSVSIDPPTQTSVDPLTLDPKTRYKLMQARLRKQHAFENPSSHSAPTPPSGNFWGSGARSAFQPSDSRRLP